MVRVGGLLRIGHALDEMGLSHILHARTASSHEMVDFGIDHHTYLVNHLFSAIHVGDAVAVERLLKQGVSPNSAREREETALMLAVERGYERIAQLLLDYGADINARGAFGSTALMTATGYGRVEAVRLLLAHGADMYAKTTGSIPVTLCLLRLPTIMKR